MADIFVGTTSAGAANGTSWANRYGTLNAAEDKPVVAGDRVICGPGVYRELLTVDVSGGSTYATGTVSVTNGSAVVTGSGTTWTGNVFVDGLFQVAVLASGTDGVADGTTTFTSAAGNFQAGHVGQIIRINTKAAYTITARASATSITLSGSPAAGTALTYNVGPEPPYRIATVDSNTQITLTQVWNGPTLTGLAYLTWRDIHFIADVSGRLTDGIGGIVRITGSDNDTTATRANCITATSKDYRTFTGFAFDTTTSHILNMATACGNWIIQDCYFGTISGAFSHISLAGTGTTNTIRRCIFTGTRGSSIVFSHTSVVDNAAHLVENCIVHGIRTSAVSSARVGGITVRNCTFATVGNGVIVGTALTVGQTVVVNNCSLTMCNVAFSGTISGEIVENYNALWSNTTDRTNTATGANSNAFPPLFNPQLLLSGFRLPQLPMFGLSEWSALRAITGTGTAADDLNGATRPATAAKLSWGAIQHAKLSREVTTVRTGTASLKLADAGVHQIYVQTTAVSTIFSVYVQWEADYAGTKPQLIIKQPGQSDTTVTATGSSGSWELLTTTLTPAASPGYVIAELKSSNTAAATNFDTFFDDFTAVPA